MAGPDTCDYLQAVANAVTIYASHRLISKLQTGDSPTLAAITLTLVIKDGKSCS